MWVKQGTYCTQKNLLSTFCFSVNPAAVVTKLFISLTRAAIGADRVTSHRGEMEHKICPDGQNKGFGWKSGKQRGPWSHNRTGKELRRYGDKREV